MKFKIFTSFVLLFFLSIPFFYSTFAQNYSFPSEIKETISELDKTKENLLTTKKLIEDLVERIDKRSRALRKEQKKVKIPKIEWE